MINTTSGQGLGGTTSNDNGNYNANVISGVPLIHPSGSTKDNLQSYINKAAFFPAPAGTYGNSGRGILRGPGSRLGCALGVEAAPSSLKGRIRPRRVAARRERSLSD